MNEHPAVVAVGRRGQITNSSFRPKRSEVEKPASEMDPLLNRKLWIDRDLERICQRVRLRSHTEDGDELSVLLVGETFGPGCSGMGVYAVTAAIDRRRGNVDQIFVEWVERTRFDHNLFDT